MKNESPLFKLQLVGLQKETTLCGGLGNHSCRCAVARCEINRFNHHSCIRWETFTNALQINHAFVPWIQQQHAKGAEIASLCMGAFLLASTGLLNGKEMCNALACHANEFRKMFPQVNLIPEKVVTDEKGIYSSGGAYSYLKPYFCI